MPIQILTQQQSDPYFGGLIENRSSWALRPRGCYRAIRGVAWDRSHSAQNEMILVKQSPSIAEPYLNDGELYSALKTGVGGNTPWPQEIIEKLSVVDLGSIGYFDFGMVKNGLLSRADASHSKFEKLLEVDYCPIDNVGALSLFNDDAIAATFLENAPEELDVIHLESPCRGGQGHGLEEVGDKFKKVSKETVLRGNCIFAFKATFTVIENWKEVEPVETERELLLLGMFEDSNKVLKYKRLRNFLASFRHMLLTEPLKYVNYEEYQRDIGRRLGRVCAYWDVPKELFKKEAPVARYPHEMSGVNPDDIFGIIKSAYQAHHPEKLKLQELYAKKNTFASDVEQINREISELNRTLINYQRAIEEQQKRLEDKTKKYTGLSTAITEITEAIEAQKAAAEKLAEPDATILEHLRRSVRALEETYHVRITKITGLNEVGQQVVIEAEKEIDSVISNITAVEFITLRPSEIHVDKWDDSGIIKAGGPYKVQADRNYLRLSLVDISSVFGRSDCGHAAKVHPHTPSISIAPSMTPTELKEKLVNQTRNACLGDAAQPLYKAFETNNLKLIIVNCLNWIGNAYSEDGWGCDYTMFPDADEVNFNPDFDNLPEIEVEEAEPPMEDQEDMDSLIEAAMEALGL
jgi:hypothetical protein